MNKYLGGWINANVWFVNGTENIWNAGRVRSLCSSNHDPIQHTFVIEHSDTEITTIITSALDSFLLEFQHVKKRDISNTEKITDMTSLSFLNEPEMVECLRKRYLDRCIYTNIGPILVAVNPFEQLDVMVYSIRTIEKYFEADQSTMKTLGPHVFQISNSAYTHMFIDKYDPDKRENQSILINGESGAGKTESTKQVMRFLAVNSSKLAVHLASSDGNGVVIERDIEGLIVAVNPITESLGNAKTSRNNNSSRFGKFIELCYCADGYITSAHIQTYLLETVRVTSQLKGERNYHLFYEVFAGLENEVREKWKCESLEDFSYVNTSGEYHRHDGESDYENYTKLVDALATVNMSTESIDELMQVVIAILHMGNLTFESSGQVGEDAAVFGSSCQRHVNMICELLGVSHDMLLTATSRRAMKVAGNVISKNLNVEGALYARDVLARTTYDLIFRTVLNTVNHALSFGEDVEDIASFVAVLDIFGFEYFDKNSFEQLCINYANEKLQDHFNYAIFKSEREVYEEEGIKWVFKDYPDNSERLDLFEHKRTGMFLLCDEQLKIPKPSDDKLVKSLYARCMAHIHFESSKAEQIRGEFVIHHFACPVKYSSNGFVEKNRNEVASEIFHCFESSSNAFVQGFVNLSEDHRSSKRNAVVSSGANIDDKTISKQLAPPSTPIERHGVARKTLSVTSQFSRQLQDLITKIRSTRSHFIRCIKPNSDLQASNFDRGMVTQQLRCGGALGAVQVFQAGFPNRMEFKYFVCRYAAFLAACGLNALTRDLYECISRARSIGADNLWHISASMLIDIVSLTIVVLNMTSPSSESIVPEDVDIFGGMQLGKTQVFLRAPVFELLERLHARAVNSLAIRLQRQRRASITPKASIRAAAANSLLYYAFKRRIQARKCVSATVVLQRRFRVFLACNRRRKIIRGITLFKAFFRGAKARAYVRALKFRKAQIIQTVTRRFLLQTRYRTWKRNCLILQCNIRCFLSLRLRNRMVKSILLMQRMIRGTLARIRTIGYRLKLKQAALEAKRRAAEARSDFMSNLDEKLKSNPNLLFDMLGASEKIALLGRQNEALLHSTHMLEEENAELREDLMKCRADLIEMKRAVQMNSSAPMRRGSGSGVGNLTSSSNTPSRSTSMSKEERSMSLADRLVVATAVLSSEPNFIEGFSTVPAVTVANESNHSDPLALNQITPSVNHEETDDGHSSHIDMDDTYIHRTHILLSARDGEEKLCKLLKQRDKDRSSSQQQITAAQERISTVQERIQQLLAEKNNAQRAQLTSSREHKEGNSDVSNLAFRTASAQVEILQGRIKKLHEELSAEKQLQDKLLRLDSEFNVDNSAITAELSGLRQIILYMTKLTGGIAPTNDDNGDLDLVTDVDTQWAVKDLNRQNAALTDELRRVKMRFTSVLGKMEAFSMSKFRSATSTVIEDNAGTDDVSNTASELSSSTLSVVSPAGASRPWQSDVSGVVKDWSRQSRRDVSFIVSVRVVGDDVRDWTLLKSFADFKAFRAKLKPFAGSVADGIFPGDGGYSLFSLSDEVAEERREALNSYLIAVCGAKELMATDTEQSCELSRSIVKQFLRVDEYRNMDPVFARDAGLTIQPLRAHFAVQSAAKVIEADPVPSQEDVDSDDDSI